jgi:hypothetical protein
VLDELQGLVALRQTSTQPWRSRGVLECCEVALERARMAIAEQGAHLRGAFTQLEALDLFLDAHDESLQGVW